MPKIQANGINIHYWQLGEGPDIVMLHGLTGNLAIWSLSLAPDLRKDYRLTIYDLRGHGRSEMPLTGYTSRDMAQDLAGLMDALGIERAHLIGHSLGADIALHFSILYPERINRIVALEAGIAAMVQLRKDEGWAGWYEWAKAIEKYGGITIPKEKWTDVRYMLRACLDIPIQFGPARGLPRKQDQLLRLIEKTTIIQDYEDDAGMTLEALATIQAPVLLGYGANSTYIGTYDALLTTLPNVHPYLMEGCDHFGVMENHAILVGVIRDFLLAPADALALQMHRNGHA